MDKHQEFQNEKMKNIAEMSTDDNLKKLTLDWQISTDQYHYTYNFSWMGRPIIQYPQDIVALQEIIWKTKPDLIIETGVAHGGSIVFSASMLELLGGDGIVVGIDIEIRPHNKIAIDEHPMKKRICLIEGSSISEKVLSEIKTMFPDKKNALLILDSDHTHDHVLKELQLYSPFIHKGGYIIVMDTGIEDFPSDYHWNRSWGKGNNPKTAVHEFVRTNNRFEIDATMHNKLLLTTATDGYLKCIRE